MKIACPACDAAYEVPEAAIAPGRTVRCARCGRQWEPVAAAAPPTPDPVIEQAPPPHADPDPTSLPPQSVRAAWVVSLLALGLLAGAAAAWRNEIMHIWPPSARLYALFGSSTK